MKRIDLLRIRKEYKVTQVKLAELTKYPGIHLADREWASGCTGRVSRAAERGLEHQRP